MSSTSPHITIPVSVWKSGQQLTQFRISASHFTSIYGSLSSSISTHHYPFFLIFSFPHYFFILPVIHTRFPSIFYSNILLLLSLFQLSVLFLSCLLYYTPFFILPNFISTAVRFFISNTNFCFWIHLPFKTCNKLNRSEFAWNLLKNKHSVFLF